MITVKIRQDPDPESPREFDNLGVMACWHSRYNLGDVQPKQDPQEWIEENAPEGSIVLPLYLYDHSGISISTSAFACPWDSGQVGVIVATPEHIRKMTRKKRITKKLREDYTKWLAQEVATYDDFLQGNVWGYEIEGTTSGPLDPATGEPTGPEVTHDDSCWGFIGSDATTLDAMLWHVDAQYHDAMRVAWEERFS